MSPAVRLDPDRRLDEPAGIGPVASLGAANGTSPAPTRWRTAPPTRPTRRVNTCQRAPSPPASSSATAAAAAAAVALLLAGGDGALWQVFTLLVGRVGGAVRHLVGAGLVPLAAPRGATGPMPAGAVLAVASWLGSGSVRRRGPPAWRRA